MLSFSVLARRQETEESEEQEVQEEVTSAVVTTPTPEFDSDDDDEEEDGTNFEDEALIPTQEHRTKVETSVAHSTTAVAVTESRNKEHHSHHRKGTHNSHRHTQTIAPPEETEKLIDDSNQTETFLDSLLAQYFPEVIKIPHRHNLTSEPETENLPDERNKNPGKQQHVESREQIQTATRKPRRQKKKKTTTQRIPTTKRLTTAATTETMPQEEQRNAERGTEPTRQAEITRSILAGRVDISVQHLGTEVTRNSGTGVVRK